MKILKRLCAVVLSGCLFLCGSGFSNKYEDVQTIELKSNPTTGYSWDFEVLEGLVDPVGEVEISRTFESDNKNDLICGTGGTEIFEIKGVKEGKVGLLFEYKRVRDTKEDCNDVIGVIPHVNKSGKIKILRYTDL